MSRTPLHYADQRNDALGLVADLAHVKTRHDVIYSNPGTKAEAYAYRHRIYRWRRTVLAILSRPGTDAAAECLETLRPIMGPRFNRDWLDYTRFDIEPAGNGQWRVKGSLGRVMYGPDLVFADDPEAKQEVNDMRALLDAALRSK